MDTHDTHEEGKATKHTLTRRRDGAGVLRSTVGPAKLGEGLEEVEKEGGMRSLPVEASDSPESQESTPVDFATVRATVEEHLPALWPAIEAGLSTCATLLLSDNVNPVALIYVGPPSAGKTTVAGMFEGVMVNGYSLVYRSDKFTPASFVTHSARMTETQLAKVDLLPKIRFKILLTPELSPIFKGRPDELAERLSIITRVLDGQGLTTDSGVYGRRGYTGDYLFAWIGCTTPFDDRVWEVMAQLGSRLFFLVMDTGTTSTVEDMVKAHSEPLHYNEKVEICKKKVGYFVEALFTWYGGVRKVQWDAQGDPTEVLTRIAQCATLLAVMRTPIPRDLGVTLQPESPLRANSVLYNLARGHALVNGRTQLSVEDLPMVARVAVSSVPQGRRNVFLALAKNEGQPLTVKQVENTGVGSRHTAERVMGALEQLGVMKFEKEGTGKAARLTIRPEWSWCMAEDFRALLLEGTTCQESGVEN